jgi:hypothetical protein
MLAIIGIFLQSKILSTLITNQLIHVVPIPAIWQCAFLMQLSFKPNKYGNIVSMDGNIVE